MPTVKIDRVYNGYFSVTLNGEPTAYWIVNGDLGCSGNARNMYGIRKPDQTVIWVGSLAKAKKTVTYWLTKA